MSKDYSISNNYSILNNYHYHNKNCLISTLDWLSTPCRKVLGGKNIYVNPQTYGNQMTLCMKITVIFFSVLIFPVAVISIASLIAKQLTFPQFWEKKIITSQSIEAWKIINLFNTNFNEKNYDAAIDVYQNNPVLRNREGINTHFLEMVKYKIDQDVSWDGIAPLCKHLSAFEKGALLDHAVSNRLSKGKDSFYTAAKKEDVLNFFNQLLQLHGSLVKQSCCEHLVFSSLKINDHDDPILQAVKLDIAHFLLTSVAHSLKGKAGTHLQKVEIDSWHLLHVIGELEKENFSLYSVLRLPEKMQELSEALQQLQLTDQEVSKFQKEAGAFELDSLFSPYVEEKGKEQYDICEQNIDSQIFKQLLVQREEMISGLRKKYLYLFNTLLSFTPSSQVYSQEVIRFLNNKIKGLELVNLHENKTDETDELNLELVNLHENETDETDELNKVEKETKKWIRQEKLSLTDFSAKDFKFSPMIKYIYFKRFENMHQKITDSELKMVDAIDKYITD